MLISFTQTYGDDRSKLFEIYSNDKRMIEFKNMFDINYYSFHNCSPETVQKFKKLNKVKNTRYLNFTTDLEHYSVTIKKLKKILKKDGCTHFFFSQDDTFSNQNDNIDFKELLEYVNGFNENFMLNLSYGVDFINHKLQPDEIKNTFQVYHTSTSDFNDIGTRSMDDGTYICTIDMVEEIYDDVYTDEYYNIWECENYLNRKFSEKTIPRYILKDWIFKNYNLFGKTIYMKEQFTQILKDKGLY